MKIPAPFTRLSGISYKLVILVGLILVITGSLNIYLAVRTGEKGKALERERTFDQSVQIVHHLLGLQKELVEERLRDLAHHPGLLQAVRDGRQEEATALLLATRRQDKTGLLERLFISRSPMPRWADVSLDFSDHATDSILSDEKQANTEAGWSLLFSEDKTQHHLIHTTGLLDPVTGRVMALLTGGIRLSENPVLLEGWRRQARLQGLALIQDQHILSAVMEGDIPWPSLAPTPFKEKKEGPYYYARRSLYGEPIHLCAILAIASREEGADIASPILISFGGSTVLALLLLLYLLLRQVAAPLNALSRQADQLAKGQEGLLGIPKGQSYDELDSLVASFNALVREIRKSEARFRLIFDHGYFQAGLVSPEGFVELANQRALDAMDMEAETVKGMPIAQTPWWNQSQDRERLALALERAASGVEDAFEAIQTTASGESLTVLVTTTPIRIEGLLQILVSGVDISQRKKAELALAQERSRLAELNLTLENRVQERTQDLHAALENLKKTQEKLLQAEKLSALGALVAGIAHELNTPIGNAITVASTLSETRRQFAEKMDTGLTRSDLRRFTETVNDAADLLTRNLDRAADLVLSFKQVAVDQSSYQRRSFELKALVAEILLTMGPSLRKTPHLLHEAISEGLVMDSYPGPLGQVLMNLITNALVHAFDGKKPGLLHIHAAAENPQWVRLCVEDNGCGIPEVHQKRVFDPFFTTKLGQGGSGLGLHIVFNLVHGLLGGEVSLSSGPGRGSCFCIRLPLVAPSPDA
ncbi:ATP-binding protein [Desulfobotulus sp.]|uniref:ATP-binding protein n=1 Tax=Desulfobotulus sp. TaxID=1940337 RepID=UPI002A36E416|nr:ATP-binding protein [Desulfobotulus sp.]MDY0164333.1 ATP-binding protein [Desulfobotulus sp.]